MPPLAGQLAIVTGASGGIGGAIAIALAREGMALHLVARDPARLEAIAARAAVHAARVAVTSVDLANLDQVEALVRATAEAKLGVLVHSAGLYARGHHKARARDEYAALFAANVGGPMYLTQLLLPQLCAGGGQVVFVNSTQALAPSPTVGLFAATQQALKAMADTLRDEVNGDGIRVLSVFPGRTATRRQERIFAMEGRAYVPDRLLQPEDVAAMVVAALKLPRTAEVTNLTIRPMLKT